jgi:hypothetical protein
VDVTELKIRRCRVIDFQCIKSFKVLRARLGSGKMKKLVDPESQKFTVLGIQLSNEQLPLFCPVSYTSKLDTDINCSGMTIKTPSLREFSLKGTAALPLGIIVLTLKLLILFC